MIPYTQEEDTQIIEMCRKGLSGTAIANSLGRTRNSVIGRISRNKDAWGIQLTAKRGQGGCKSKFPPKARVAVKPTPRKFTKFNDISAIKPARLPVDDADLKAPVPRNMTLLELGNYQCRWPVNVPRHKQNYLFCGHTSKAGSPYCAYHAKKGGRKYTKHTRY